MTRYHFNPETGNPNVCRAKPGKCPYLKDGIGHYASKEATRAAVEEFYETPFVSKYAQILYARHRIQEEIFFLWDDRDQEKNQEEIAVLVKERAVLDDAIREMNFDDMREESIDLSHEVVALPENRLNRRDGKTIYGTVNMNEGIIEKDPELYKALSDLSVRWMKHLSTEEMSVVNQYASNPKDVRDKLSVLDQALKRAPSLEPVIVWSGLGSYVADDVLRQYESGRIKLDYPISTTFNAAQINGFMEPFSLDKAEHYALEIETTEGASMMAVSHNSREVELLIPSGEYEVIGIEENVRFLWNEDSESGRMADKVIRVRRVS